MTKTFFSIALSAALALGVTTAPAQASDHDDVARALAGLAALALIGVAINEANKDSYDDHHYDGPRYGHGHGHGHGYHPAPAPAPAPKPKPRTIYLPKLPKACLKTYHTQRGDMILYGQRCLKSHKFPVASLPQDCKRHVRHDQYPRTGYAPTCLRKNGVKLARH